MSYQEDVIKYGWKLHCINAICNLRKNRGATLPQVTENVNAGHDHTVSARTVRRQLHREGYYNRAAMHKPLITKMNAHLELGGAKKPQGSTEMWKKVMQSNESSFALFSTSGREWREGCTASEWYKSECSTRTVRASAGSVMLWGDMLLAWSGYNFPLTGLGHCQSIPSCSELSPFLCDETFLSWWKCSLWQCLHPQSTRGHWMVWWEWELCESYAVAFTATQGVQFKMTFRISGITGIIFPKETNIVTE